MKRLTLVAECKDLNLPLTTIDGDCAIKLVEQLCFDIPGWPRYNEEHVFLVLVWTAIKMTSKDGASSIDATVPQFEIRWSTGHGNSRSIGGIFDQDN